MDDALLQAMLEHLELPNEETEGPETSRGPKLYGTFQDQYPEKAATLPQVEEPESPSSEKEKAKPRSFRIRSMRIPLPSKRYKNMTIKQVADIIRLQLMQIQTDNPTDDDFYFQVYSAKMGEPWKGVGFPGQNKTKESLYRNPDGTPKLSEGTMGRIAHSNARMPRSLLQTQQGSDGADSATTSRKDMFRSLSVRFLIEEGYRCIMDMEDVDGLISSNESDIGLWQQKHLLDVRLLEHLGVAEESWGSFHPESLVYLFTASKSGRTLVLRSLLSLGDPFSQHLMAVVLGNLYPILCPMGELSPLDRRSGDAFMHVLGQCPPHELPLLFKHIMTGSNASHMVEIAATFTGSLVLDVFLQAGHMLRQTQGVDPMILSEWFNIYAFLINAMHFRPSALFAQVSSQEALSASPPLLWRVVFQLIVHADPQQRAALQEDYDLRTACARHGAQVEEASQINNFLFSQLA